jgi:uncharacterized membrane protein YgaE (UPF0421/DUF939 family)
MRFGRPQLRFCSKVGLAGGLGYALTQGNFNDYAIYSAFAASLVVGTSIGEDLATSANRILGTFAGMIAAMVATALFGPNWITVGLASALTAAIALASGWGIQAARVGVTVCVITLVAHSSNPLQYDLMRTLNTLIGVGVGLAVSFLVWPARGRDQVALAMREVMAGSTQLLDAMDKGEQPLRRRQGELHDALSAVVKAWRDLAREKRVTRSPAIAEAQVEATLRLGLDVLSCALRGPDAGSVQELRQRIHSMKGQGQDRS